MIEHFKNNIKTRAYHFLNMYISLQQKKKLLLGAMRWSMLYILIVHIQNLVSGSKANNDDENNDDENLKLKIKTWTTY